MPLTAITVTYGANGLAGPNGSMASGAIVLTPVQETPDPGYTIVVQSVTFTVTNGQIATPNTLYTNGQAGLQMTVYEQITGAKPPAPYVVSVPTSGTLDLSTAARTPATAAPAALFIPASVVGATGDLIVGAGAGNPTRLPVGTNGTILTADSTKPNGVAWEAASTSRKPYQFPVSAYGAKGDGRVITDAAITASSTTLTSATAGFTSADVGKHIMVNNAGPGGGSNPSGALITTIAGYTNATTVTLAAAASSTVSAMTAVYGTDDTAAVQSALAALSAYSGFVGVPYYAELLFDAAVYILATYPTPGGSGTYGFAQVPLPVVDLTGTKPKPTIVIKGVSDDSVLDFWHQAVPQASGALLLSMIEVTSYDPTYGPPSVIGGPTITSPFTNQYNNVLVVIDGIGVMCPVNPGQIALDFNLMCQFAIKTASLDVFGSVTASPTIEFGGSGPTNSRGQGLRVPTTGLNDRCDIDSLSIEGYYYGMSLDEHVAARRIAIIYSNTAFFWAPPGGNQLGHAAWIGYASVEICNYCLYVASGASSLQGLVIDALDNEGVVTQHIYDPNNALTGRINLLPSGSATLPVTTKVVGGNNLEITSLAQTRGTVTAPGIPTSGTALQNPFWRNAMVTISGGTVSAIAVDGTTLTGVTTGVVMVPSGRTITLTYSVAPTWTWILS